MSALADLERGRTLRYDGAPIAPSGHAVRRCREKFYPHLTNDDVRARLPRILAAGAIVTRESPARFPVYQGPAWGYLVQGDMCFPFEVKGDGTWLLLTCLAVLARQFR